MDPAEFLPPAGLFLVAEVDGVPAGCGAWRALPAGEAEIKRVYVEPAFRRRGLAQLIVAALEDSAARAGHARSCSTPARSSPRRWGSTQRSGTCRCPGYGIYACAPDAVFLGKELGSRVRSEESTWAS